MLTSSDMAARVKEISATYAEEEKCPIEKDVLAEYYSNDIELHMPYGIPPVIGIDNVLKRILLEQSLFEHFEMEFKEPIVAGDTVILYISGTMLQRKDADYVGFEAIEMSQFNPQGKICKKTLYIDLETLEHALGQGALAQLVANT